MVAMDDERQEQQYDQPEMALIESWAEALQEVGQRIGGRFARTEAREQAMGYLRGLLSPVERKNSWQLAEALGEATPYGKQHLLGRARWDPDVVRDDLQQYVADHLGDAQAILIVDETGFLKKGEHSAGVQRQYSGTAGKIENCQLGVFLAYASRRGHTLIDRELYLPESWTSDRERCRAAGIPDSVPFQTKPALALAMLQRAAAAGLPIGWVTGDCVYGDHRPLRRWLEDTCLPYVLGISGKETVAIEGFSVRVSELLAVRLSDEWTRLSAGDGAKGPRLFDWQRIALDAPALPGWQRWLLVRRNVDDSTALATFLCFAPADTSLATLVEVAGSRWHIEACFEAAKGEVGLDHYEVRSWTGWYRHITLAMWAHALLTVLRAAAVEAEALPKKGALLPPATGSLAAFKRSRGLSSA